MRFRDMTLRSVRGVSVFSCLWLGVLTAAAQQRVAQPVGGQMQASSSDANRANAVNMAVPGELPESPGAVRAQELGSTQSTQRMQAQSSAAAEPQSPTSQSSQSEPAQPPSQTVQPSQTAPQKPVGTAAAETSKVSGVAASQPAGVAIAPAKQRRVRTIVIRVGAILGAGAAVGTVVALTQATPSKPPGAH
jgi:hypothetical protein